MTQTFRGDSPDVDDSRTVSVGKYGDFSTFKEAINYVQTQDHFEDLTNDILGDLYPISAVTWTQGSKKVVCNLGFVFPNMMKAMSEGLWVRFTDETTETYAQMSALYSDGFSVKTRRMTPTLSIPGNTNLSILRPIFHRIVLLEDIDNEGGIPVTVPMNLIIEGISKEILLGGRSGDAAWTYLTIDENTEARYGTYEYKSLHLMGKQNMVDNPRISAEFNNIRFLAHHCKITNNGSDWSSTQNCGEFLMCNNEIHVHVVLGGSHFVQTACNGDMTVNNNDWYIDLTNLGASGLFTGNKSAAFFGSNNNFYIQNPGQNGASFSFLYGSKGNEYNCLSNNIIYGNAQGGSISHECYLVKGNQQAGETQVVDSVTDIVNCHVVGDFAGEASLYEIAGVVMGDPQNGTVNISHSSTVTPILIDSYDTLNCLDNDSIQATAYAASITPNANLGRVIQVGTLTGAITINAPVNPLNGAKVRFIFEQDAGGTNAITWNAAFKAQTLSAGSGDEKAIYDFEYDGTHWVQSNTAQWL